MNTSLVLPLVGALLSGVGAYRLTKGPEHPVLTPVLQAPIPTADAEGAAAAGPISFPGVILPPETIELASRHEGKLASITVKMGDHVVADQVLATLDSRSLKQELAAAEASRKAAIAEAGRAGSDFANARARSQRRDASVKVGDISVPIVSNEEKASAQFEARSAASRAAGAAAAVHERAARLEQLKLAVSDAVFRAPFEGVVSARYLDSGAFVRPGAPVLRIISTKGLRVRFAIPEEQVKSAALNKPIDVSLDDGRTMNGLVEQIAPEIEASSRTLFIEASLNDGSGSTAEQRAVLAGRVVRVQFHSQASGARP